MQKLPIRKYIFFGTAFRFLQDQQAGDKIHGDGFLLDNIQKFLDGCEKFGLPVTARASYYLKQFQKQLSLRPEDGRLTVEDGHKFNEIMRQIRHTLMAESSEVFAFITSEKRHSTKRLLENIGSLMRADTFEKMPTMAQLDMSEAGKCIVFERSTAAAFHSLRGTESVLRGFYLGVMKRKRLPKFTWGQFEQALAKKKRTVPQSLIEHMAMIRRNYRNPTAHPDAVYSIDEAQNLFAACIDLIERMVHHESYKLYPEAQNSV